jgi:hypothetical protein
MSARSLAVLERCRDRYGADAAEVKQTLLRTLARTTLATPEQVRRLHEVLCFLRAYPDNAAVLRQVESMLAGFSRRRDLRMHHDALAYSGIAGTLTWFPFFYPTARWIAARWPGALRLDRSDTEAEQSLAKLMPALMTPIEAHALREAHLPGYEGLDRLRGRRSDATFVIERVAAMPGTEVTREAFYDAINPSCELLPVPGVPSRTLAYFPRAPRAWQTAALPRGRPELRSEIVRAPRSIRRASAREAEALLTLAHGAMITRQRDLDSIAYGNPRDVWLVDDGGGLAFALIGMVPERRAALPALHGGLTLQNGVPIGYHQADFLGRSAAISFNTFDTFRGGASAHVFARWLAALHAFSGATSFSIEPYQLGQGNEEGIESGAWWFYTKLGFRPRARAALRLAATEVQRQRARPGHRSTPETLRRLAAHHVLFDLDPMRPAPLLLPTRIGLRVGAYLAELVPDDRDQALARANELALNRCGVTSLRGLSRDERVAWSRLAPLFAALPPRGWTPAGRAELLDLARKKGAPSERSYAQASVTNLRLEHELARWSRPIAANPRRA